LMDARVKPAHDEAKIGAIGTLDAMNVHTT
jgi:hypothetical protein